MTEVEYSELAVDCLEGMERTDAAYIVKKIDEATEWTDHRLKRLTNSSYYKLRAGDYRAVIDWQKDQDVLFVVVADHRSVIYDRYADVIF